MQTFDALTGRHGVLRFRPTPVAPEQIDRVLRAAIAAPSPANTQPWALVVVTDPALARQVAHYLMGTQERFVFRELLQLPEDFIAHLMRLYAEFDQAPCFIVICRQQRANLAPPQYAAMIRDWDMCALGALMANLMAQATDLGLGTRYFGGMLMESGGESLKALLGIPDDVEVVAVTPLGYHDEAAKARPAQTLETHTGFERGDKYKLAALLSGKLPLDEVVSWDRYGNRGAPS